jgi:hypothetical protein
VIESALDDVLPATPALIRMRFDRQAKEAWGKETAEALTTMIANLENEPDIRRLDDLCAATVSEPRSGGSISSLPNKRQGGKGRS